MTTSFITEADLRTHLWEIGDLTFDLRKHQLPMHDKFVGNKNFIHTWLATRGAGKTHVISTLLIEQALQKPGCVSLFAVPYTSGYSKMIERMFAPILANYDFKLHPEFVSSQNLYKFPNGSVIYLMGLEAQTYERIKKMTLTGIAIIDEVQDISEDLEEIVESVILPTFRNYPGKLLLSGTLPKDSGSKFLTVYIPEAIKNGTHFTCTVYDIGWSKEEIERVKRNELHFARQYLCTTDRERDEELLIPWFDKDSHILKMADFKKWTGDIECYVGFDWGSGGENDPSAAIFIEVNRSLTQVRIVDEIVFKSRKDCLLENIAQQVRAKEIQLWGSLKRVRRFGDNDPGLINNITATHKLPVTAVEKTTIDDMLDRVNIIFKRKQIQILERCKHLLGSCETGRLDKKGQWQHSDTYAHFDSLAAAQYALISIANLSGKQAVQQDTLKQAQQMVKDGVPMEKLIQRMDPLGLNESKGKTRRRTNINPPKMVRDPITNYLHPED